MCTPYPGSLGAVFERRRDRAVSPPSVMPNPGFQADGRACQEQLGISAKRYLTLRRMHLFRRALRESTPATATVTEIATRFGFWQFGRLAGEYRALFSEVPSETLARQ